MDNQLVFYPVISIHALREEGDPRSCCASQCLLDISIHALREEGDFLPLSFAV